MTASQPDNEAIFHAARDIPDPDHRRAYVRQACGGDEARINHVEALLLAAEGPDSLLDHPAGTPVATIDLPATESPGTVIGPYKLIEQIGEGGMGSVWMAQQTRPVKRLVAVKLIRAGMDSQQVIARFEAERQALALMDHPNIATVLDGGTTAEGRPYFVMELVKGVPITDFCDQERLVVRERLALFTDVCAAVQHAHQKGVIHRDLKPSNVLVTLHDGKPVVKVIDFGIAKATDQPLTEKTLFTRHGQIVGTFEYMSPEQATLDTLDVDTRSDVYSLAVLLYELLTGTTPLDKERLRQAALGEVLRLIREEEPPRPSNRLSASDGLPMIAAHRNTESQKLPGLLRGDLDWIVMKGLDKDRTRRYETASALAADVRRFLSEEPVEARPPSVAYRLRKFVNRNRGPVVAAAVVLLALVAGVLGTTWGMVEALAAREEESRLRQIAVAAEVDARNSAKRATDSQKLAQVQRKQALFEKKEAELARQKAEASETKAEWRLYASNIASAQRELAADNFALFYHYLKECRQDFRGWEHDYLYTRANPHGETLFGHTAGVDTVAWSPDGKRLASASSDGTVTLWNTASLREILSFKPGDTGRHQVLALAFSPDGKRLATLTPNKLGDPLKSGRSEVKLWDTANGKAVVTCTAHPGQVSRLAFGPDGKHLAGAGCAGYGFGQPGPPETVVILWDAVSGKPVLECKVRGSDEVSGNVAFSPDGTQFAASRGSTVKVWELASRKEVLTLEDAKADKRQKVTFVAFSPDGQRLVSSSASWGSGKRTVTLWDLARGKPIQTFQGKISSQGDGCLAFSPDGKCLASASNGDFVISLWDTARGREIQSLNGHAAGVKCVAFSPDGKRLASAGETVKLWDLDSPRQEVPLTIKAQVPGHVWSVAFNPDGTRLASGGSQLNANAFAEKCDMKLWNAVTGKEVLTLGPTAGPVPRFYRAVQDPDTGQRVINLKEYSGIIRSVAFSPDGKLLARGSRGVDVFLTRGMTKYLYALKLWDAATGKEFLSIKGPASSVSAVAFSPDGKRLASAGGNSDTGELKLWDVASGREVIPFEGHRFHVWSVAFSPNGKLLASGGSGGHIPPENIDDRSSEHGEVKLWDATTGKQVKVFKASGRIVMSVAFSPDRKLLASASNDGTVQLWDLATGKVIRPLKGHTGAVSSVAFSLDGKRLASGGNDKMVRLWDVASGQEVLTLSHSGPVSSVAFSPDGKRLAGGSSNGTIIIWDASKSMREPPPR
jgi:WD40 repeat protein/serine/threonine protein kinase